MNYDESLAYIDSLAPTILNPDLTRFAAFMKLHGSPQDSYRTFHVAGTNGKGSTVAIIDSVLRAGGYNVGRFTGPHLLRWNERFHINGKPISDEKLAQLTTRLRGLSEEFGAAHPEHGALTWFELLTAIAFFHFAQNNVDFAVIEVGLGGRWDATNVITSPLVTVITTIDYDHTHILGNTLSQIAGEKAGIIKPQRPIITGTTGDALETITARSTECGAPLYVCAPPDSVTGQKPVDLSVLSSALAQLALVGNYQQRNAYIAGAALKVAEAECNLPLTKKLSDGFRNVYWPGRFQWLPERSIIFDGAHNVAGARALRSALDAHVSEKRRVFVLSFFQNKDVLGALEQLLRPGDRVIASQAKTTRAVCSPEVIAEKAREIGADATSAPNIREAFESAVKTKSPDEVLIVTGSFATVKESMVAMGWRTVEDGIKLTYGPDSLTVV